ncbi:MAG: CynX/NimT family MFS transporter [Litorivicinaceae bacterium]
MTVTYPEKQQWTITATTVACGAVCGVHIAKLGPSMPSIMDNFGISLTEAGILASTFTLLTIFTGIFVGNAMSSVGVKRLICIAMLLSLIGSLMPLTIDSYNGLVLGRALEGIGLIIMMIAGPTAVSLFTQDTTRAKHTGFWSAFMPIGTALSFLMAPLTLSVGGWQSLWFFSVLVSLIALLAAWVWIPNDLNQPTLGLDRRLLKKTLNTTTLIWLGCVFAMHSLVFHIILQFIPIYGTTSLGSSFSTVSYIVAGYCLLNVCGNFLAGQALHRGMRPYRLMSIHFMAVPFLATALFFPDVPDPIRFMALIIGAFFTSLTPSAAFTLIAKLAEKKSEIPAFNGLMLQVQGAGILFGPSITGWAVETYESWTAAGFVLICASILVLLIINLKIKSVDLSI